MASFLRYSQIDPLLFSLDHSCVGLSRNTQQEQQLRHHEILSEKSSSHDLRNQVDSQEHQQNNDGEEQTFSSIF